MHLKLWAFIWLLQIPSWWCVLVYKSTKVECLPNPEYIANETCYIKAVDWYKGYVQMDAYLIKPLRNVTIVYKLFKKDYSNRYQPFLVNVLINLCEIISKRNFLVYGKLVYGVMARFTNLNHSCPFEGHIYSRELFVENQYIPDFPEGQYQIAMKFMENFITTSEEVGTIKLYIDVLEKINKQPKKNVTTI